METLRASLLTHRRPSWHKRAFKRSRNPGSGRYGSKGVPNFAISPDLPIVGTLLGTSLAIGQSLWRLQLEIITASMIGNHVARGGARVLQIGGGTRQLYYYPKGTVQVTVTQSAAKKGILENGGLAAKVPVVVRDSVDLKKAEEFNLGQKGYYDSVVMLQKFSEIEKMDRFLREVKDVLKPDGSFIFIEKDKMIMESLDRSALFDDIKSDVALEGKDDHIVGVAKKAAARKK